MPLYDEAAFGNGRIRPLRSPGQQAAHCCDYGLPALVDCQALGAPKPEPTLHGCQEFDSLGRLALRLEFRQACPELAALLCRELCTGALEGW